MKKPTRLKPGDKIGVFAPSSPVKEPYRGRGLEKIRELGYEPVEAPGILGGEHFLAAPPQKVLEDLQRFFHDPQINALWAARGGYGSNHLLPLLKDLDIPEPKIVIGSSDVGYLLWYLLDRFNMVVFYGPMAYSSLPEDRFNGDSFLAALSGSAQTLEIPGRVLSPGNARGMVTGGCLSNLVSLLGTPYFPRVEDRLLLLEDTGERPYRLDRMFWQLKQAGVLDRVKGLLLGQFPGCFKDDGEKAHLLERIKALPSGPDIPVIYDLPVGHSPDIHTLPLGVEGIIDTQRRPGLLIGESAVR